MKFKPMFDSLENKLCLSDVVAPVTVFDIALITNVNPILIEGSVPLELQNRPPNVTPFLPPLQNLSSGPLGPKLGINPPVKPVQPAEYQHIQ